VICHTLPAPVPRNEPRGAHAPMAPGSELHPDSAPRRAAQRDCARHGISTVSPELRPHRNGGPRPGGSEHDLRDHRSARRPDETYSRGSMTPDGQRLSGLPALSRVWPVSVIMPRGRRPPTIPNNHRPTHGGVNFQPVPEAQHSAGVDNSWPRCGDPARHLGACDSESVRSFTENHLGISARSTMICPPRDHRGDRCTCVTTTARRSRSAPVTPT
jgi:hypothetical protein